MAGNQYSAEKYAFLFDRETSGDLLQDNVGNQRVKSVRAGDMLYLTSFPVWSTRKQHEAAQRAPKHAEAVRKINQRNRRMRFEQIVHANFRKGDYFFTATYSEPPRGNTSLGEEYYRDEPKDEAEAQKNVRKFIRVLRRMVKKKGGRLEAYKYLYVTEETYSRHPDPAYEQARYHHHMLISRYAGRDANGNDVIITRDEIEELWQSMPFASGRTRCDVLQPDRRNGLSGVANYMMKSETGAEQRDGRYCKKHSYAGSKNLIIPAATTADHKISKRRVQRLAQDVRANAREIFERLYPDYELAEEPTVRASQYVEGAYFYARMIRREGKHGERRRQAG